MDRLNARPSVGIFLFAPLLFCISNADSPAQGVNRQVVKRTESESEMAKRPASTPARLALHQPEFLEQYAATHRFGNGRPTSVEITRTGDAVLFLRSGPRSAKRDLYEFNVATGAERVLATAAQLLGGVQEQLSAEEKARRERMRLSAGGIASFEIADDGRTVLMPLSGKLFLVERATGAVRELTSKAGSPIDARFSPDGKLVACVRNGELYVIDLASGHEKRLTHGA